MLTEGQDHINLLWNHTQLANGQNFSTYETTEAYLPPRASFRTGPCRASRLDGGPLFASLYRVLVDGPVYCKRPAQAVSRHLPSFCSTRACIMPQYWNSFK
jgi:hypothetical protein